MNKRFAATMELHRPCSADADIRDCDDCQHSYRTQEGPHAWRHDCRLKQSAFPDAAYCDSYQPAPRQPERNSGMGYVWDYEYEGRP